MNKIINTQNDQCFDVETNMIYLYVRFLLENHLKVFKLILQKVFQSSMCMFKTAKLPNEAIYLLASCKIQMLTEN